jgi:RNA recognition motif-containing protein
MLNHLLWPGAVIIFKPNGERIFENEAREVLSQYGALDFVCSTAVLRGRSSTLPHGVYARFAFYLDCRDALKVFISPICVCLILTVLQDFFGHHDPKRYRIQLATGVEPILRKTPHGSGTMKGLTPPRSATDIKSIFIGGLPEDATREDLVNMFQEYGTVVDSNVVTKIYPGNSINVFGFVEYATSDQASAAAADEHFMGDKKLRVEPKEYSARRATRLNTPISPPARTDTPAYTPRRITPNASRALAMRLMQNEAENSYSAPSPSHFTPPTAGHARNQEQWQTPRHYIPAHLFSPSPQSPMMPYYPQNYRGDNYYEEYQDPIQGYPPFFYHPGF